MFRQIFFYFPFYIKRTFSSLKDVEWLEKIRVTKLSPELSRITTVRNAGRIIQGKFIMHNGIKIFPLSYYNKCYYYLLSETKGIHEPQEEFIFSEILKVIPENSTMLELGSYWAFYSIWFNKTIKGANNFMIEAEIPQLMYGKYNFKINKCKGTFYQAFIDSYSDDCKGVKITSIDDFVSLKELTHINILHSDIQGLEENMLKGAKKALSEKLIDFLFISTHDNSIHERCIEILNSFNYVIVTSINIDESFSVDGLIVACSPKISIPYDILLSIKSVVKRI